MNYYYLIDNKPFLTQQKLPIDWNLRAIELTQQQYEFALNNPSAKKDEILNKELNIVIIKSNARRGAENYISKYFTIFELVDMLKRLNSSPNTNLMEINNWVESVQNEAIINYQNPNFEQFGNPPYSYLETL